MNIKFEFLGKGYYCCTDKYNRITYDPLLLADFADIRGKMIDLCSGNGIIPLLLHRNGCKNVMGIELDADATELAKRGAERSRADINFICGDVRNIQSIINESFDAVTVNPPYFNGKINSDNRRSQIRNESTLTLNETVSAAAYLLKSNGRFYMCHRPERFNDILLTLNKNGFYASKIKTVAENAQKCPFLVLIEAVKGKAELEDLGRFNLKSDGEYTAAAKTIFFPERNE